ncbi:MAG: hypothetical protein ACOC0U_03955 [Desulfovibrionales bacterium]
MDDLKAMIRRARYDASVEKQEMVIGRSRGQWYSLPKTDPGSDSVRPGIIVDETGVKYPDHREMVERILSGEELE